MTPPPTRQPPTERQAKELADALKTIAQSVQDTELADMLVEVIAKVERHADFALRRQTQGVIGSTYVTLQERLDELLSISKDTHLHMMDATTAVQAIDERMAVFDRLLQEVSARLGEMENNQVEMRTGLTDLSARVDHLADGYLNLDRQMAAQTQAMIDRLNANDRQLDQKRQRLDQHEQRINVLQSALDDIRTLLQQQPAREEQVTEVLRRLDALERRINALVQERGDG